MGSRKNLLLCDNGMALMIKICFCKLLHVPLLLHLLCTLCFHLLRITNYSYWFVCLSMLHRNQSIASVLLYRLKKFEQVPSSTLPRQEKPRRVDLYFASWVIKPAQSLKGDGHISACEVVYLHYEGMGIPKDVSKFGVRHGMWGTVKKLHSGFRAYQDARRSDVSPTRFALMARITTKLPHEEVGNDSWGRLSCHKNEEKIKAVGCEKHKGSGGIDWKWLAIGGTVAVVCGLRMGLIGRALLIGAGHRISSRPLAFRRSGITSGFKPDMFKFEPHIYKEIPSPLKKTKELLTDRNSVGDM